MSITRQAVRAVMSNTTTLSVLRPRQMPLVSSFAAGPATTSTTATTTRQPAFFSSSSRKQKEGGETSTMSPKSEGRTTPSDTTTSTDNPPPTEPEHNPAQDMDGGYGGEVPREIVPGHSKSESSKSGADSGSSSAKSGNSNATSGDSSAMPDALAEGDARGRTGGGQPLGSSSENAPAKPKVLNGGMPGGKDAADLSKEQQREVDEHNKKFAQGFDHAPKAAADKVDDKYWAGSSSGNKDPNQTKDTNTQGQHAGGADKSGKDDRVPEGYMDGQDRR